ncbi:TRAP transporter substrate-binding protein [Spartinivicinus poritis]|uniref:TRAP transporter substrate-binding protein n=1 Tax=Spartinivicinus poritis TaxID=2994640 RepID=A0ABT5UBU6_9GAMM|nr:TRAP transporter substrate-binding protein [Spartinivicinus sp. A2-2]MDE1463802.1 TRAP transporter substrate-binding protein [Spartinivicinus sp. A2-2]
MKQFSKKLIISSTIVASIIVSTQTLAAKKVLLKTPIAFSSSLPALGTPIKWVSQQLPLISGGSIKMKLYEPNKLVAPFEILDAVSTGKVNSGYTTAGYWAGKMAAASLFSSIPFGPEAPEYMAWLYYGNGLKLYQEMYDNAGYKVKVLPCAIISPETSGWFKKPITSPEDFKGLNIRFFGLGGEVLQKLGASTSLLPGGEIFSALEKGAIEATEYSQPAIDEKLGIYKVAKHNYFPGWHQQSTIFELLVNKKQWQAMSKSQQSQLSATCMASVTNSIAESEYIQFDAIIKNENERGVKMHNWDKKMLATFKQAWQEVAAEQSKKDPMFNKVYQDLSNFRKKYANWASRAFLPRSL